MNDKLKSMGPNLVSLATLLFMAAIGITAVYSRLPTDWANFVGKLRSGQLSRLDRAAMERGYYEDLTRVNRFNNQLWEVYMSKPKDWLDVGGTGLTKYTGDFVQTDLAPSFVARTSWSDISTNRWGMRDQDYEKQAPAGTKRIALLGASLEMGWGVEDGETYEAVLEDMLNGETDSDARPYQVLNFAVAGYRPLQQMASLERALEFGPDVVIFVAHGLELTRSGNYLSEVIRKDIEIPYPRLREIAAEAGVGPETSETMATRLLTPYREKILSFTYAHIADTCRERGIVPALLMFEQGSSGEIGEREIPRTLEIAEEAGFEMLVLEDVYAGYKGADVKLARWDKHPNALGHRLIAEALYSALAERPEIIATSSDP
jgi:hypothetical protein